MKRFVLFLSLAIVGLASCEKRIPFDDPGAEPRITVNSLIEPTDSMYFYVSKSASILNPDEIEVITNAQVEIFENGNFIGNAISFIDGDYFIQHTPQVGSEYTVKVAADGLTSVEATTSIPTEAQLDFISMEEVETIEGDIRYEITMDLHDAPGENFYVLRLGQESSWDNSIYDQLFYSNEPVFINRNEENYYWEGALFDDATFDGSTYRIKIQVGYYDPDFDYLKLFLINASEDHFKYRQSYDAYYESNGDPFAQPVQIYGNVENGYGVFAGHVTTVVPVQ